MGNSRPVNTEREFFATQEKEQQQLLHLASDLLKKYVASAADTSQPVVKLGSPQELLSVFQKAGVPLQLGPDQPAVSGEKLAGALELVLQYSVRTHHPLFFNQLYARHEPAGVTGEWVVAATNTNVHTFEVAPVFSLVEVEVLKKLAGVVGYPQGGFDGLFVPGGSISNLYAIHLARYCKDPEQRKRGAAGGPTLVAFTSSHSHYSYAKSAFLTGLGTDNMVAVDTDEGGRLLPKALETAIEAALEQGKVPFFVGLTAGTTVTGAFDPIPPVLALARKHGLWVHVDGSWGAAALLSPEHRSLLQGVEEVDSLAWNLHKMLGVPIQCSAFITKHPGILAETNAVNATYLFQEDKLFREYDLGDKTIQCGRKPDAFKAWLQWKAVGDQGWVDRVNRNFVLAEHIEEAIKASGGAFQLVIPRSFTNVCFFYIPPSLRPFDRNSATPEQWAALGAVAPAIKARMQAAGDALIGYQPLGKWPNFFRIVIANAWSVSVEDLDELLKRIDEYGRDLKLAAGESVECASQA